MATNNQDQMHPQDRRNLILFAVLAISMWLGYDYFVARPHAEAMRAAAVQAQAKRAEIVANAPAEILDTAVVKPLADVLVETRRVRIENDQVLGTINQRGARLDDLRLKEYYVTAAREENVHVLTPARTKSPRYVETGWIAGTNAGDVPGADTLWQVKGSGEAKLTPQTPVTLVYTNAQGVTFEKTFSLSDDFAFTVKSDVINRSGRDVTVFPYALVTEHGIPTDLENRGVVHEGPIGYVGEKLEERSYKGLLKKPEETITANSGWIGITSKYWLTALIPGDMQTENRFRFVASPSISDQTKDRYQSDITGAAITVANGATATSTMHIYSGAKKLSLLSKYEKEWNIPHFDLAVDFGWFYFLTKPFLIALTFLYGLTGNFGVAIIIFTCILRVFVFPLANTSYRSFAKLRQVSPEMYTIRHQYKDDKQKLQQELVKLYQKHNVNPMAGCLPIIVQIPIFFALYKVLSNSIEMRHAPFFGWIQDLSAKDPTSIFNLFGLLPYDAPSFLMIGAWPIMMMIGMVIQKNLSPPPEDPIQKRIIGMMPYVMGYIMAGFASGLVIYWTFNNLLAIIQQMTIMKMMGVPIHLFKTKEEKEHEKEIDEGPSIHPELEVAEQKIEEAITGEDAKPVTPAKPKKKKKK